MFPRTVMNDRSLAAQIAASAILADSRNLFIGRVVPWPRALPARVLPVVDLHEIAVGHAAHGVIGPGDHLIALLEARSNFEVLVAGDSHLDRHELGASVVHREHALCFLSRLAGLELGDGGRFGRSPPAVGPRLLHDLTVRIVDELAHGNRRYRNRLDVLPRRGRDVGSAGEARSYLWG